MCGNVCGGPSAGIWILKTLKHKPRAKLGNGIHLMEISQRCFKTCTGWPAYPAGILGVKGWRKRERESTAHPPVSNTAPRCHLMMLGIGRDLSSQTPLVSLLSCTLSSGEGVRCLRSPLGTTLFKTLLLLPSCEPRRGNLQANKSMSSSGPLPVGFP